MISEGPADRVEVVHAGGESDAITTRSHAMLTDQPASAGERTPHPPPAELLVAALASCVAIYAGRGVALHRAQHPAPRNPVSPSTWRDPARRRFLPWRNAARTMRGAWIAGKLRASH
jgi:hypothetical protein